MFGLKREIDQVAKDKGIDASEIVGALEEAMKQAARREKGQDREIEARYNEELGEIELFEFREVVEEVTDPTLQVTMDEARKFDPEAELGDEIGVKLDTSGFGRILAQTAKQVIIQRIREAERENVYEEYKDRKGEILNGIVRRFEKGAIIVDLGRAEAVLPLSQQVPRENYRPNDRLRAYVIDVNKAAKGSQIVLSRTCLEMLTKLFEQEVPEMYQRRRSRGSLRGHEGEPRPGRGPGAARGAHRHRAVEPRPRSLRLQRSLPGPGIEGDHR
jgi:N utilization substance protein A